MGTSTGLEPATFRETAGRSSQIELRGDILGVFVTQVTPPAVSETRERLHSHSVGFLPARTLLHIVPMHWHLTTEMNLKETAGSPKITFIILL